MSKPKKRGGTRANAFIVGWGKASLALFSTNGYIVADTESHKWLRGDRR